MNANIIPWSGKFPKIADDVFVAHNATIIGDVEIASQSSIWFNAVIRGDVNFVKIGSGTNIQDGTIIHVSSDGIATIIGDNVLVGHNVLLHACTLMSESFIGMSATVMDGAIVESHSIVAAGSLVLAGTKIRHGEVWGGIPAKFLRKVTDQEIIDFPNQIKRYIDLSNEYKKL